VSTNCIPEPGTAATFKELKKLTHEKDGAELVLRRRGKDSKADRLIPYEDLGTNEGYFLTDGPNYLWVSFDNDGTLFSADRFGASNVDDLVDFCGEMVDEYDDHY